MPTPSVFPLYMKGGTGGGGTNVTRTVKNVGLSLNERQSVNLQIKDRPRLNVTLVSDRIILELQPKDNLTLKEGVNLEIEDG